MEKRERNRGIRKLGKEVLACSVKVELIAFHFKNRNLEARENINRQRLRSFTNPNYMTLPARQ
jgi:hypothetical protein